jgi:hypothetical protein
VMRHTLFRREPRLIFRFDIGVPSLCKGPVSDQQSTGRSGPALDGSGFAWSPPFAALLSRLGNRPCSGKGVIEAVGAGCSIPAGWLV